MEVKINSGAFSVPPAGQGKPAAQKTGGVSFAADLKAAAAKTGGPSLTAEAVFEQALSDRNAPDFQRIDDFLEKKIQEEMQKNGGY